MAQIVLTEGSAAATPSSNTVTVYAKTDGKVYSKDDAGTEYDLTAQGLSDGDKGDITVASSGASLTIDNDVVTNAKLANVATATFKGRTTAGTGDPEDLTTAQATALLDAVVGDFGSGGTKGLVPAPAAGDAAANKFLKANGTWTAPSGSGDVVGPASSTNNSLARFDGTTGKLLKDGAVIGTDVASLAANTFTGLQTFAAGADIASAATVDLTAATGNIVRITGTTATSTVTLNNGQMVVCVAVGAWPLTHHSTNHPLPGGTNYTCSPGDRVIYTKDNSGAIGVQIVKKDGTAVVNSGYSHGLFRKADPSTVAFTKTGAGTAQIKAGTKIDVAGTLVEFASATSITMPTLTAGTDYAIWVKDDATIQADASFTSAPGAGNWRKIGGFHYAPGGNATGTTGGDTTAAINDYSFWDLKFKPACPDPRGMTLVADSFWADIYLLGVDHLTNGTSKYNVSIADGSAPPKIPTKFGGSGSSAYSTLNWWEAAEVMQSWGKRLPTYDEFAALAYGTTEAQASGGTDVPTTGVNGTGYANTWNEFTSKWGVIQATGCMWIWGGEFGGPYGTAVFTANTGGRGSTYNLSSAVVFGGRWANAADAGSRASSWSDSPTSSSNAVGARGVCDHLILE